MEARGLFVYHEELLAQGQKPIMPPEKELVDNYGEQVGFGGLVA